MATAPAAPATISPAKQIEDEAQQRLADARAQKAYSQCDIQECYYFTAPRRIRSPSSQSQTKAPTRDQFELQTSLGIEVADDFMTMLIDSFMPPAAKWAERHPDPFMPAAIKETLLQQAKQADDNIFEMIRSSNFYAELGKTGVPDAAIGVLAMDIRLTSIERPPLCIAAPIRELEINLGPDGRIDDRFVVRPAKYRHVPALLRGIDLSDKITKLVKEKPNDRVEVQWGYWRVWDRTDDEWWQHVVMVGKEIVHSAYLKGEGSCPLAVGRFGAAPDFAWPDGPMIKSLPDLRQVDEMRAGFIENIDFTLRPPGYYPDDGVMNLSNGIEPGEWFPKRPGGGSHDIGRLFESQPLDAATFEEMNLEKRIRRLHYCDFPEQKGKTPPTLGQWLDEMVEAQKKIGTPGYSFWREFPFEVFQRFKFIAEARGGALPLEAPDQNGVKRKVSLQAYNPAQRAQENQDVLTATRLLQIIGSAFPQTAQVIIDDVKTSNNLKEKLGDKVVAFRGPDEIKQGFANLAQVAGVRGPQLDRPGGSLQASDTPGAPAGMPPAQQGAPPR